MRSGQSAIGVLAFTFLLGAALLGTAQAEGDVALRLTEQGIQKQQSGAHSAAIAFFEASLSTMDHPKTRYFLGKSLDAAGRSDEALSQFESVRQVAEVEKYAMEIDAYIRAINLERKSSRLAAELAALEARCTR